MFGLGIAEIMIILPVLVVIGLIIAIPVTIIAVLASKKRK